MENIKIQDSEAVKIALTHIDAWCNHEWEKTKNSQ